MALTQVDYKILLASLVEIKELQYELVKDGQPNSANALNYCSFDRAGRLERGEYFDRDNPGTIPHSG